jgi:hypothetical protein
MADLMAQRAYTVRYVPPADGLPEFYVIRLTRGALTTNALVKAMGMDVASRQPPRENLTDYWNRLQASVVVNASGWWGDANGDGDFMGAQILDGQIVKDWEPHSTQSWIGTRCAALLADGTLRTYTLNTPAAEMLADGVVNTFSQGALAIVGGKPTNFAGSLTYEPVTARTLLGEDFAGNLYVIVVPGKSGYFGATGQQILELTAPLALKTLVLLDGGGSSQLMVDGQLLVRSSDTVLGDGRPATLPARRIPDVLAFYAPRVGPMPVVWRSVDERRSGWSGGFVQYAIRPGEAMVRVLGVDRTGPATVVGNPAATVCVLPDEVPRPSAATSALAYLNGEPTSSQNARVGTGGTVDCSASTQGKVSVYFRWPLSVALS